MKRAYAALAALVGLGLVLAACAVLMNGTESFPASAGAGVTADAVRPVVVSSSVDPAVVVRDPLLVVNKDGSATVGADLQNVKGFDVSLTGVVVWVDRHRVPVNATEMWLPVLAGDQSQVGAASDAGGFVLPSGINDATRADLEFRFDDGTCVVADVTAVARTNKHRLIYPNSNRSIGPVISDEPEGSNSRNGKRDSATCSQQAQDELADAVKKQAKEAIANKAAGEAIQRHELRVTIREQSPYDAYAPSGNAGGCVRATSTPSQLIVMDASKKYPKVIADPEIPSTARLTREGNCEAVVTVEVPYASLYRFGVAIEGHGISQPTDPGETEAKAESSPQLVIVPR